MKMYGYLVKGTPILSTSKFQGLLGKELIPLNGFYIESMTFTQLYVVLDYESGP